MSVLENRLKSFFNPQDLWVLGLSGGPDSMALFYALKKINQPFVIAHVDHGWRDESCEEAETLSKWAGNVPFYCKTYKKSDFSGNLEQDARLKRLSFFRHIVSETGAKGVILAHHADDLSETLFKKLLEGVPFHLLGSMKKLSDQSGLILARPLLDFTKKELLAYVGNKPFFQDSTNFSAQFLRGRLRSDIFPYLTESFGKNVEPPLAEAARDCQELSEYLQEVLEPYKAVLTSFGAYIDLSELNSAYLLKVRIHRFFQEMSLPIFKREIRELCQAILEKKRGYSKVIKGQRFRVEKDCLFLFRDTCAPNQGCGNI